MQTYVDEIFAGTGLKWISGYYLPQDVEKETSFNKDIDVFEQTIRPHCDIYVAQLAEINSERDSHNVIKEANLWAWMERKPIGAMVKQIAIKNNFKLAFQMVPHQPGYSYLNVFMYNLNDIKTYSPFIGHYIS